MKLRRFPRAAVAGAALLGLVSQGLGNPLAVAGPTDRPSENWAPAPQEWKPVENRVVSQGGGSVAEAPVPLRVSSGAPVPTGEFTASSAGGDWVTVGASGVEVSGARASKVKIAEPSAAAKESGVGLIVGVEAVPSGSGEVSARISYDNIADRIGGEFGDRVELIQLPECALTTPDSPECFVPLGKAKAEKDPVAEQFTVSAVIPRSGGATVMALSAGASGASGSFAAQPLSASSLWSAGSSTGEFAWSYPLQIPGVPGEVAPQVGLSYSSATVDGRVASTNNQPGWIGQGWAYEPGFIERTYVPCADDPAGKAPKTSDLCWWDQTLHMSLGGTSAVLVRDAATGVWHPKNDDGTRIERLTGAPNGVHQGEYWKVTSPDGLVFYFGREALPGRTNQELSGATWSVPVFGAKNGDPCYNSAGFAASQCMQAWRWNLDYVEDTRGNAAAYFYAKEYNHYMANNGAARTSYVRGGTLSRIEYGLRNVSNSIYGSQAPARVVFSTAERCIPGAGFDCSPDKFTAANAAFWPDTPRDLACSATGVCTVTSPTFWSQRRLTRIQTEINAGKGFAPVDRYDLVQTYPDQGDKALWLSEIRHTGFGDDGKSLSRNPVRFSGQLLANRVDGYRNLPPMLMWRMTRVDDEVGGITSVSYTGADCTSSSVPNPNDLASNTRRCFPVKWTLPYQATSTIDFFHKYLVSSVRVSDATGISPPRVTSYEYVGSPAWRFDDNELVKPKDRTWGQFRGYGQVDAFTGDTVNNSNGVADKQTHVKTFYLRGMNGDRLANGGTRSVSVQNSLGESTTDLDEYAGKVLETQTLNGRNGGVVSKRLFDYTTVGVTSTRSRIGLGDLSAKIIAPSRNRNVTMIAGGGSQSATTTMRYDARGRRIAQAEFGDGVPAVCTVTSYAENQGSNIYLLPATVNAHAGDCPASGAPTGELLSSERHYYDGSTTLGVVPGPGNQTRAEEGVANNSGRIDYAREDTAFDAVGRPVRTTEYTSSSDTTGRVSSTKYTPALGGPLAEVVSTLPSGVSSTSTYDPRGRLVKLATSTGSVTEATYDPLGRIEAIWDPGMPRSGPASKKYSYGENLAGPDTMTTIETTSTGSATNQVKTVSLYNAFGDVVQTQSDAVGGGRVVSDTYFDSHGWQIKTNNHWYTTGEPATSLITTLESGIDSITVADYDGMGRVVKTTDRKGNTKVREVITAYSGNQVTALGPEGGATAASVFDSYGRTIEHRAYSTRPNVNPDGTVTGGEFTVTKYGYDHENNMTSLTDAMGAKWLFTYDMAGRKTRISDPDAGVSTNVYNHAGDLLISTDARGEAGTLNYTYDKAGRVTKLNGGIGNKPIGEWVYDTIKPGLPSESKSFINGDVTNPYVQKVLGYDAYGRPTGTSLVVPQSAGKLAGTYTNKVTYTATGDPLTVNLSAAAGLPDETLTYGYNTHGLPTSLQGNAKYVNETIYNPYGKTSQIKSRENNSLITSYEYDPESLAVSRAMLSGATAQPTIVNNIYTRDKVGKITRVDTSMNFAQPSANRTMCYSYDTLQRLTTAWTAKDGCALKPDAARESNPQVGGIVGIWQEWTFNAVGARTSQTKHQVLKQFGATETTTYKIGTLNQVHATAESVVKKPGVPDQVTKNVYDQAGNTIARSTGLSSESIIWNAQGKAETISKNGQQTKFIYTATGEILGRTDATGTTVYTPTGEVSTTPDGQLEADRYYSFDGDTIAHRTHTGKLYGQHSDPVGTALLSVDWSNLEKVTWRFTDPYGNELGSLDGPWPNDRTFLNLPTEATSGLVQTGARLYDPTQGRFMSVDPVLGPDTPQSLNSYAYTQADPINSSDPSGLWSWSGLWNGVKNFVGGAASYAVNSAIDTAQGIATAATYVVTWDWDKSVRANQGWSDYARSSYQRLEDYVGIDRNSAAYKVGYSAAAVASVLAGGVGAVRAVAGLGKLAYKGVKTAARQGAKGSVRAVKQAAKRTVKTQAARVKQKVSSLGTKARKCSFSASTQVLLADGATRDISQIAPGDLVTATDPETGEQISTPVEEVFVHDDTLYSLETDAETITTTEDHPFWSVTDQRFERADELAPGEQVLAANGSTITVKNLKLTTDSLKPAYNLHVRGIHTYHVGKANILVHNECGSFEEAKGLVQQAYGKTKVKGTPAAKHAEGNRTVLVDNEAQMDALERQLIGDRSPSYVATKEGKGDVRVFNLSEGKARISVRGFSRSGGRTIEIYKPNGKLWRRVHIFNGDG